jgi:hypothetical protein
VILLATQAEAQMRQYHHPHLGRLATPDEYSGLTQTVARDVVWAADNGCYNQFDPAGYTRMLDTIQPHADTCLFVTIPDTVGDATATAHQFETWWPATTRRGLPTALVAQDGLEHHTAWLDQTWPRLNALFIGGTTTWKLGEHARALIAEARRRHLWVHMGRVNTARRIAYAREIGCHSFDGTKWVKWRRTYMADGLARAAAPPQISLLADTIHPTQPTTQGDDAHARQDPS